MKIFIQSLLLFTAASAFAVTNEAKTSFNIDTQYTKDGNFPSRVVFDNDGVVPRVSAIAFDSKSTTLASAAGKSVLLWRIRTGELAGIVNVDIGEISQMCFFNDDKRGEILLICGGIAGENGVIAIVDMEGNAQYIANCSDSFCAFDKKGNLCVAGAYDGTLIAFEIPSGKLIFREKFEGKRVRSVSLSEDANTLVFSLSDGVAYIRKFPFSSDEEKISLGSSSSVCAITPDGKYLIWTQCGNGAKNLAYITTLPAAEKPSLCTLGEFSPARIFFDKFDSRVVFLPRVGSPIARNLKSFGNIGREAVGNVHKKSVNPQTYRGIDSEGCYSFAQSHDGNVFATGGENGRIFIWRSRMSSPVAMLAGLNSDFSKWGTATYRAAAISNSKVEWIPRKDCKLPKDVEKLYLSPYKVSWILEESFNPNLKAERAVGLREPKQKHVSDKKNAALRGDNKKLKSESIKK